VREKISCACVILAMAMILPAKIMSQGQIKNLVLSGHAGGVSVAQINGKNYVEIEALARIANGSLSFKGNQITLTLPTGGNATTGGVGPAAATGFSRAFLRSGIEELSTIGEWHGALESAIDNQIPVGQSWLAPYAARATTNLRLVQVATITDADRSAAQLVANDYQKMKQLSDKYVAQRASLSYIERDSLENDALNQSVIACGKSLEAMAAGGQFVDDGACD
jgi:hypothetical protein